ncbi:MAG: T9SS type A sorting domain-containing protein [Bacteroidia bacterium]|nr:T9SS type A sorting domain-containing protein [Bacteroidia bacterium]
MSFRPYPQWRLRAARTCLLAAFILLFTAFTGSLSAQLSDGDIMVSCSADTMNPNNFVVARFSPQGFEFETPGMDLGTPGYHGPTNNWTVDNLGEIFGIAIDPAGRTYLSATAVYGPYAFNATHPGGGVYMLDVAGVESLLGHLPNFPHDDGISEWDTVLNQQPGLGNLCYVAQFNTLLITNFEDGKIYSMDAATGSILDTWDPLVVDDPADGWSPLGERLWGIGSVTDCFGHVEVYYGVWVTDFRPGADTAANTVRRIELDATGHFLPLTDAEVIRMPDLAGYDVSGPVSDIAFSSDGLSMLVCEKTMIADLKATFAISANWAHQSRLLEYTRPNLSSAWVPEPIGKYHVGTISNGTNTAGGVDYGLWDDDSTDTDPGRCDTAIWVMGAPVFNVTVYGLQQTGTSGGGPADGVWINLTSGPQLKGLLGDVEILKHCNPCVNPCDSLVATATPTPELNDCCFDISLFNNFDDQTFYTVTLSWQGGTGTLSAAPNAPWQVLSYDINGNVTLGMQNNGPIPSGAYLDLMRICFNVSSSPFNLLVEWKDEQGQTLCHEWLELNCETNPECLVIVDDTIYCDSGQVVYEFYLQNLNTWPVQSIVMHVQQPGITVSPNPLQVYIIQNDIGGPYRVILSGPGVVAGEKFCWFPSIHSTIDPETAPYCCSDTTLICHEIPDCSPCDSLDVYVTGNPLTCTYQICVVNHWDNATFTSIETELINGGVFTGITPETGWHATFNFNPTNFANWTTNPAGFIPLGTSCIGEFSLDYTPVPTLMVVRWMNKDSVICTDTLSFVCDSSCAGVLSDSIFCKGDQVHYNFNFFNNAGFDAELLTFVVVPPSTGTVVPNPLIPGTPVQTGHDADFSVEIQGAIPGSEFCYYIIVHDHADPNGIHLNCCPTDTICDTIPDCKPLCTPGISVSGGDTILCGEEVITLCPDRCPEDCLNETVEWSVPGGAVTDEYCITVSQPGTYCLTIWCDGVNQGTVCQTLTSSNGSVSISGWPGQKDCVGDPVTLTANTCCPEAVFHWSNGATTPTINVVTQPGWNSYSVTVYCGKYIYYATVSWTGQYCSAFKMDSPQDGYQLDAFPNPFTETTTLRFGLAIDDVASLDVFASDGRLVKNLFHGPLQAGQTLERTLKANDLARGIYYLRLQTARGVLETRKLILTGH